MKRIGFIDGRRVAGWRFPATATPGNGQVVDVTDPSVGATGDVSAQILQYRPTGNKTGYPYSVARSINVYPQGNTFILEGLSIYFANPVGSPTISRWWALDVYMEAIGALATVQELVGITIGMNFTNAPTGSGVFLRLYTHGTTPVTYGIRIGGQGVSYLFTFDQAFNCIVTTPVGGAQTRKIRIWIDNAAWFIPLNSA